MPSKHQNNCLHIPCSFVFGMLFIRMGTLHAISHLQNNEGAKKGGTLFFYNDYTTGETGGGRLERMENLLWEQPTTRRTIRRITIFNTAINGHLYLPVGHLLLVQRQSRHLYSKALNTIHTRKKCYKYFSYLSRTVK